MRAGHLLVLGLLLAPMAGCVAPGTQGHFPPDATRIAPVPSDTGSEDGRNPLRDAGDPRPVPSPVVTTSPMSLPDPPRSSPTPAPSVPPSSSPPSPSPTQGTPASPSPSAATDPAILEELSAKADLILAPMQAASNAMESEDWVGAVEDLQEARQAIRSFNARLRQVESRLQQHEAGFYDRFVTLYGPFIDGLEGIASWNLIVSRNVAAYEAAPQGSAVAGGALRALAEASAPAERAAAGLSKVAVALGAISADVDTVIRLGFRHDDPERFPELAAQMRQADAALQADVADILANGGYGAAGTLEARPVPVYAVSQSLESFFASFDADGTGSISRAEGAAFFEWVEANVVYRYDDEATSDPYPGFPVGDGRNGRQYTQTPDETWAERAGDCEDMNRLEVAFYNHFGVPAYQAFVNAEGTTVDHAIAIVRVAGTMEEAQGVMGRLDAYTFADGNRWGIPAGVYAIVDNAYSDDYGFVSGGVPPEKFTVFQVLDVTQTFEAIGLPVE